MSYCLNPSCQHPVNPDAAQYCQHCGDRLRLKERYRPVKMLGKGGFGRTFLAVDDDIPSRPPCVIKQLYLSSEDANYRQKAIALFQQEAVRLDELGRHPQIPQLLAHFAQDDTLYLVQEFVDGLTLRQAQHEQGCFAESQIWQLLLHLLPVLDFIHQRRVIHRDIKPDNIIYCRQSERYVLIDFGVAKLVSSTNQMKTGTVIGSPEYMAPEQTRGKTVPATDLYSLGVTCLAMMTTVSPIDMFDIVHNRWVWRDFMVETQRVSDRLGQILDKLLESALSQRYQTAQDVLEAIASTNIAPPNNSAAALPLSSFATTPGKCSPAASASPSPPPNSTTVELEAPTASPFFANLGQAEVSTAPAPISVPVPLPVQTSIPKPEPPQLLQRVFNRFKSPQRETRILSQQGIDYTPLYSLLGRSQWLKADQCTQELMCQAVGKSRRGYLHEVDVQGLPCDDLAILDQLWRSSSRGRFGFVVQLQLYLAVESDYGTFCQQVGWPVHRTSSQYLQATLKAPPGHFPSRDWVGGPNWWHHLAWLQQRWQTCHSSANRA